MLQVKNLSFKYPGKKYRTINKISFVASKGEHIFLCGKSGAGKSTLLELIYGLHNPSAGSIQLNKIPLYGPKYNLVPGHEEMKYVNQNIQLLPNHTIFENIVHHLKFERKTYKRKRAFHLAEQLGIQQLLHLKPHQLSGGEQQRAAIAQAIALPPELILLDEPFAHLDYHTQNETKAFIHHLLAIENITSITVTHQPSDALKYADKILFLENGKLTHFDLPETMYNKPKTLNCAQFFGHINKITSDTFLRSHHFIVDEKGHTFTIVKKWFGGVFWEYTIKNEQQEEFEWVTTQNFEVNEHVKLSWDKSNEIKLPHFPTA